MPELELWVHDAWTGDEVEQLRHLVEPGTSWSTNLTGTGECAFVVGAGEDHYRNADLARLFTPNARLLALRYGTTVLGAWKTEEYDYDEDSGTVTVTGNELRGETKWRMTYALSNVQAGTLIVENKSISGAVRAILARFMQWTSGWHYPIDLPADGPGDFSAEWPWWKKFTIADLLAQIEEEGYEVVLRPYLSGRQLRFQTLVAPKVTHGQSYFHLQAEDRPLSGVRWKVSGMDQVTGVHGLGEGTGQDQATAVAGNMTFLIPARDVKVSFPDATGARLQAATDAARDAGRHPIEQWTVGAFTVSDTYGPEHALTGRAWRLDSKGHPVFPDGPHALRVIAAKGTWSKSISTEVQSGS